MSLKNAAVEDVLNLVLKGKNISFKVEDNIIYLSEKKDQNNKEQQQTGKEKKISGQVVDESGEPLIGVNVLVKGTTNGVITDFDGNYALVTNEINPVITFSYIGYKSQEIPFKGQNVINLTLQSDTQIIDEVVVTALGIRRKRGCSDICRRCSGSQCPARKSSRIIYQLIYDRSWWLCQNHHPR